MTSIEDFKKSIITITDTFAIDKDQGKYSISIFLIVNSINDVVKNFCDKYHMNYRIGKTYENSFWNFTRVEYNIVNYINILTKYRCYEFMTEGDSSEFIKLVELLDTKLGIFTWAEVMNTYHPNIC